MISNTQGQYPDVVSFKQCPVPDSQRQRTDLFCTICSSIFSLVLFIICCATFNNYNLKKMTFLTDSDGKMCAWDYKQTTPILYYTSLTQPTHRLCVSQCPKGTQTALKCQPTQTIGCGKNDKPKYQVSIYPSEMTLNRIGLLCIPTDEAQRQKVLQMSGLEDKFNFLTVYDSIWTSIWISIVFGCLRLFFIQLMPRKITHWSFILGSITCITIGILMFIIPRSQIYFNIIVGILFIFMGVIIALSFLKQDYREEVFICGRLIEISTSIVKDNYAVIVYILIWWLLQIGLIAVTVFELLSAWSIGPLTYRADYPFYQVGSFISNLLSALIFIQFIWGLSFLKQSFNFCVSGYATLWYCYQDYPKDDDRARNANKDNVSLFHPLKRLLAYHWGSVVGGSLLLWLFYFVDLFVDFMEGTRLCISQQGKDKTTLPSRPFTRQTTQRRGCRSLFDLIRSQSFAYINLIPIPYCNASRYCQMLDRDSHFYDRSQITNRLYRLASHIVMIALATLLSLAANNHVDNPPTSLGVIFIAIISLFSVTYFIGLHGDLAEGIYISVILQQRLYGISMGNHGLAANKDWSGVQMVAAAKNNITRPPAQVRNLYFDDLGGVYEKTTLGQFIAAHTDNDYVYRAGPNYQNLSVDPLNRASGVS